MASNVKHKGTFTHYTESEYTKILGALGALVKKS